MQQFHLLHSPFTKPSLDLQRRDSLWLIAQSYCGFSSYLLDCSYAFQKVRALQALGNAFYEAETSREKILSKDEARIRFPESIHESHLHFKKSLGTLNLKLSSTE